MTESVIKTRKFYGDKSKRSNKTWERKKNKLERCAREFSKNPILPKRQRIDDPAPIFETFPRQQMAFDYLKTCHEDVHVFAREKDCYGKRVYIVATLPYFWYKYTRECSPEDRNYYEVIPEGAACRLYFDLEFKTEFNPGKDGAKMVDIFIKYVCHYLEDLYGLNCNRKCIIDLDSSTATKFSRHLIFHLPGAVFKDNIHAGNFVRHICTLLERKLGVGSELSVKKEQGSDNTQPTKESEVLTENGHVHVPEDDAKISEEKECESFASVSLQELRELIVKDGKGGFGTFCDQGVYTKNRSFRILKSTKIGKDSHLLVSSQNIFKPSFKDRKGSFSKDSEYLLFLDSLVSNVSMQAGGKDVKVLSCDSCVKACKRSSPTDSHDARSDTPSQCGYEHSPYPEIDQFILSLITKGGVQGEIRRWVFFPQGKLITYDIIKNRWCENIGRPHKSNHIMIVVDLTVGVYYQKCHDPDCKRIDYRSPEKPIPQEINPLSSTEFGEFSTDDCDDQELCKLVAECDNRHSNSSDGERKEVLHTDECSNKGDCASSNKQGVTQYGIDDCVTQYSINDCVTQYDIDDCVTKYGINDCVTQYDIDDCVTQYGVKDWDNDLDDEVLLEVQISHHNYTNEGTDQSTKSLKTHNRSLESLPGNEIYTKELSESLDENQKEPTLSDAKTTAGMALSRSHVSFDQAESQPIRNGKWKTCRACGGRTLETCSCDNEKLVFVSDKEVSEWVEEDSISDLELSFAAEEAETGTML